MLRAFPPLLVALALAAHAHAATYTIVVRGTPAAPVEVTLRARPVDRDGAVVETAVRAPGSGAIELAAGMWELTLTAPGLWAAPQVVRGGDPFIIEALPTGTIAGTFAKDTAVPADLRVRFRPPREQFVRTTTPSGVVSCSVAAPAWQCEVPFGTHDLRIGGPGFSSHYLWNHVVPERTRTNVGPIALQPGAVVAGFVTVHPDVQAPRETVRVVLAPAHAPPEEARAKAVTLAPEGNGFFQFTRVPPGDYMVTAIAGTGRTRAIAFRSSAVDVRAIANLIAELNDPLVISPPRKLVGTIEPPLDPTGKPWRYVAARYRAPSGGARALDSVGEGAADASGTFEQTILQDGEYEISIRHSDGSTWARQDVRVDADVVRHRFAVPSRTATGTVTHGGKPLAARLRFGGAYGATQQVIVADEEGHFEGVIPSEDETWDVLVEAEQPPVRRTLRDVRGRKGDDGALHFTLEVPATLITGVVVSEKGAPQRHALISVQSLEPSRDNEQFVARPDGTFEILGLQAAQYRVEAEGDAGVSEVLTVRVEEGENAPLRIVVRDFVRVTGTIVARQSPVGGVRVSAVPRDVPIMTDSSARSDARGRFELLLPSGTKVADFRFFAPGFPTVIFRREVKKDDDLRIDVGRAGGTLVIDMPSGLAPADLPTIVHDGAHANHPSFSYTIEPRSDAKGTFERVTVANLAAGEYRVCRRNGACVSAYVPPGGVVEVSVR